MTIMYYSYDHMLDPWQSISTDSVTQSYLLRCISIYQLTTYYCGVVASAPWHILYICGTTPMRL